MGLLDNIKRLFSDKEDAALEKEIPNAIELINIEAEPDVEIISSADVGFGSLRSVMDFNTESSNVKNLITTYRDMALYPEIDSAIQEISNEAIVVNSGDEVVTLKIDSKDISEKIKETISEEFKNITDMMDFNISGDEDFRQWYEDGRIYYHNIIDVEKITEGIKDIKILSPMNLKNIKKDGKYLYVYENVKENFTLEIPADHITFCPSGLVAADKTTYISYVHKAMKPFNQLKMLEDSAVIYRITRAPERRVFYIDVGQMNKSKAESYMASLMNKFRNRISYDSTTGKITQQKNTMTMTEDFWLPSSESGAGGRGTRIDTLPPGQNLSQLEDLEYFKRKLLKSLRVPYSRFDSENPTTMPFGNMNGEMSRDEVRFSKFINKLRSKFSVVFYDLLKKQLIFKNIITADEWVKYKKEIAFIWNTDSYFTEVKEQEILKMRIESAQELTDYVGKYFSHEFVMKNIFKMSDEEIADEKKKMVKEKSDPNFKEEEEL